MDYVEIAPVLSVAGSDCSGGAGIQADIKTILANGCYAMTAITALTAQNTLGVQGIFNVTPDFLGMQLDSVFEDIPPKAVKIGMVSQAELIQVIADRLRYHHANNIVVDPVMVSTSGSRLIAEDAVECLVQSLFPLATVITPNIPEAELLSGESVRCAEDMKRVGNALCERYQCAVLMKGGHSIEDANDLLIFEQMGTLQHLWLPGKKIDNPNTHGTGCTLSSAIASQLAQGYSLTQSVLHAKSYISETLEYGINLGRGSGPLNHGYKLMKL